MEKLMNSLIQYLLLCTCKHFNIVLQAKILMLNFDSLTVNHQNVWFSSIKILSSKVFSYVHS